MKTTVKNYAKVAARLPLAIIGGALLLVGAVANTLASLVLGKIQDANDYLEKSINRRLTPIKPT